MRNHDPECTLCDLHEGARSVCIKPRFNGRADDGTVDILFVGEAPGATEDLHGKPFIGPAGDLLTAAIRKYAIASYGITNTVRCRPPENAKPKAKQIQACAPYLEAELVRLQPRIVVPLGATAFKRLTGISRVSDWVGRPMDIPGRPFKVFPIFHPAAVIRYPERFEAPFTAQFRALGRYSRGETAAPGTYVRLSLHDAVVRLKKMAEELDGPAWGFDIETQPTHPGLPATNPNTARIFTAAFAPRPQEAFWLVWPTKAADQRLLAEAILALLKSGRAMAAHNATMEAKFVYHHVLPHVLDKPRAFRWRIEDSLLYYYQLHEDLRGSYDLDAVRRDVVPDMPDYSAAVGKLVADGTAHHEIDLDELGSYNAGDADATLRIVEALRPKIQASRGLSKVYATILEPATHAVAWSEIHGRAIDTDVAAKLTAELKATQDEALGVLRAHGAVRRFCEDVGKPVLEWNPGSAQQVGPVVFDYLELPAYGQTKGKARSVAEKYLEPFRKRSRFVRNYLAWRAAKTLENNYLKKYLGMVAPDGRIYGSYLLFGTVTGRLASARPNLQNFSQRLRVIVRSRFAGGKIVSADYSQVELRLMAFESKCRRLLDAYARGIDVHALTATIVCTELFGRTVTMEEVLDQHAKAEASKGTIPSWRQDYGKRPNFALLYLAQPKRFAEEFHVSSREAVIIHGAWHEGYPEIGMFHHGLHEQVRETGFVRSRLGRVRRLPDAKGQWRKYSEEWWNQMAAFREASNFPVQSLASDLNTMAYTRAVLRMARAGLQTCGLGMTHDSQDYDAPADEVDTVASMLPGIMVQETLDLCPWLTVPLAVDVKVGDSWGTLGKYKKPA